MLKNMVETEIDYEMVLGEYGGDNENGRKEYGKRIKEDITLGLEIKDKVIGQSIIGGDEFVEWIKESYLKGKTDRECPPLREIQRYREKEEIIKVLERETGKGIDQIKTEGDSLRHLTMDVLYRLDGLKGVEIGKIFGVDYSTVSQGRKRLREKLRKDPKLRNLLNRIEQNMSI